MASFGKKKLKMKYVGIERRSKLTMTSGCGALVEFPGFSGIMGGQNLWPTFHPEHMKIHEKNLEELLGKEYFLQPSIDESADRVKESFHVPVLRFPEYYFCPNCHELDYARRIARNFSSDKDHTETLICSNCGKELLPSRFIIACDNGHLSDFPYVWWVHKGKHCERPKLRLEYTGRTGGLDSIIVSCDYCNAKATMANCLGKKALEMLKCEGDSPWLGAKARKCECGKEVRALMRGSNNVYYPKTTNLLTIPPWSSSIQKVIDNYYTALKAYFIPNAPQELIDIGCKAVFDGNNLEETLHCTFDEFLTQVKLRFIKNENTESPTLISLLADEYKALIGPDIDDLLFKTVEAELAPDLKPYFNSIKMVKRLREVQVLEGFRRITAFSEDGAIYTPLSSKPEKWLPATELLGEGIFFEFSRDKLEEWKILAGDRYDRMGKRFNQNTLYTTMGSFSPELVCIHTFSHLMIRELAYQCGYDASSIKEKLYICNEPGREMAGVLIYTASTCSDGSLGGLVRQGETSRLENTILNMLNRASWCSNDPICIEAKEQGNYAVNYAACHACALVSETSCTYNNLVLDRYAIVGDIENQGAGFMGELLN